MAKDQPIPRAGLTDDIAHAAVFLASNESTFINGHDLVVDGGLVGGRLWTPHQEGVKAMRQCFRRRTRAEGLHLLLSSPTQWERKDPLRKRPGYKPRSNAGR